MPLSRKVTAEFLGTLWLVLGGCGSAVLATAYPTLGIQFTGVALAFGLTVLTAAYAFGHISGGHFNPAVSVGLWAARRFPAKDLVWYIIAQLLGAIAAAGIIYLIANGKMGFDVAASGLASNGYGDHSPGNYTVLAAFVTEVVMTFFFLLVILGSTSKLAPAGFAPIAIGLCLTLIHLISIPVTNTSVNPARSTGPALIVAFGGASWPVTQLWLFWIAPILGALLAGFVHLWLSGEEIESVVFKKEEEPPPPAEAGPPDAAA